mmetsp:Transcript_1817/g.2614  ORF Transcript_1817/g.2614 Transcript_1817/m.2614 type:complete len:96 (+) Transcript_1817:529-816(+)
MSTTNNSVGKDGAKSSRRAPDESEASQLRKINESLEKERSIMDKVLKSQKVQSVRQLQGDTGSPRKNLNSFGMLSTTNSKFKPEDSIVDPTSPVG